MGEGAVEVETPGRLPGFHQARLVRPERAQACEIEVASRGSLDHVFYGFAARSYGRILWAGDGNELQSSAGRGPASAVKLDGRPLTEWRESTLVAQRRINRKCLMDGRRGC
jgi:hypothetical protein